MRRGVAIYGATDEVLSLIPLLEENPELEIVGIHDPRPEAVALEGLAPELAERVRSRFTGDPAALLEAPGLEAVIDGGLEPPFSERFPEAAARGLQIVSPLTARLLWGYVPGAADRKAELLQALHEVVDSVNLTVDPDELFARMLEIAMSVTGADGGSLMLLDGEPPELAIRVARGVEPELWPKIRVPVGDGIAGRVAAEGQPLRVRGKADQARFRILRERFDVESALCVPLVHEGRSLGVLNLHHATRADAFSEEDLAFAQQLGRLDAEIIARAQEHESLRSQAGRYALVREVREALAGPAPLLERLTALCRRLAARLGGGIATVYLWDAGQRELRLAATSLSGGGFGGEYRVVPGEGIDGRAAESRRPAWLHDADGALAYAALPLLDGSSLVGVLTVQAGPGRGDGALVREPGAPQALGEAAAAAADEIAHARREQRMAAQATKVGAINEAGITLVSARETADVVRLATSSGSLILEADHGILRLQDPESRRYVIRSYCGSADADTQPRLFRLDQRVAIDVIRSGRARRVGRVEAEPAYAAAGAGIQSLLAAPLKRDGRVIGTLCFYDKVAPDDFFPGAFHEDDLRVFEKYVSYVERAVANALYFDATRRTRSVDEDTGLPSADYLAQRLEEEIARAGERPDALLVLTCRIENLDEIRRRGDPIQADRVVDRAAAALRARLRPFDVLGRSDPASFAALLPDPGPEPEERVASLARDVADEVAKDARLNDPVRVSLAFGYARHPEDGPDREALLARARSPRIRMV